MGKIATVNTSDKVLIPDVREAYKRQTNIGSSWTEVRMGIFYTWVPAANDDAACVTENIVVSNFRDMFSFGLKNSTDDAPTQAGAQFIGLQFGDVTSGGITVSLATNSAGSGSLGDNNGNWRNLAAYNGTTRVSSDTIDASATFPIFSTSNVNAFIGLKYVVSNFGLTDQQVTMGLSVSGTAVTDVSIANLRTVLFAASYSDFPRNWNAGGAALPLPDYFYIHSPFFNNRIRITAMAVYKVS